MNVIKLTKYSDPDTTVVVVSGFLISVLREKRFVSYTDLMHLLEKKYQVSALELFLPTIDFLFLLGFIRYYPSSDSFEWLEK